MRWQITSDAGTLRIEAGLLVKLVSLATRFPETTSLAIDATELLQKPALELAVNFHRAEPDDDPRRSLQTGGVVPVISQENVDSRGSDGLRVSDSGGAGEALERVAWHHVASIESLVRDGSTGKASIVFTGGEGARRCVAVRVPITRPEAVAGVTVEMIHEIHDGHPAIRKWLAFENHGSHWIKIDRLRIEAATLVDTFQNRTNMTPDERGSPSSIVAFEQEGREAGMIACSEVPSALRAMDPSGPMGYEDSLFEWVIGPGERFETEAVVVYAFRGDVVKTRSSTSTPLDRAAEGPFLSYLEGVVGLRCVPGRLPVPLWCTWSNFQAAIDDATIRDQARLASLAGFRGFQIDAGWSNSTNPADWTSGGREPHPLKFPDFPSTCKAVLDLGLRLGLWTSCFRNEKSPDLHDLPGGKSFPVVKRGECFGMSFASDWRHYYANDVLHMHESFGATYFKQDLTNIKFGDIDATHDSRTRKESLLRGIRGFFESQDRIHEKAPGACTMLSHELYWGTPGTPCDLAAIKHCWTFHIPPNDYSGAFPRKQRIVRKETRSKLNRWQLLSGCFNARRRFYAHRGLPLYCIEYYGAATVNKDGSLTPRIQDRQVCSWLMGIPSVYAGDLSTLTKANIAHYKARFDLVVALQEKYGIFERFQYSGVPRPTDLGWHWWGKLNEAGLGIVVVLRGFLGSRSRRINVPWIPGGQRYKVTALFSRRELGTFTGDELRAGSLRLALPRWSQEILEFSAG